MVLPGPLAIQPIDPASRHDLALKPFQRVTAEVLQVQTTQAILSVEGYPVVAQLTSPDQAALLKTMRQAQFVITQLDSQAMVLKFVQPGSAPAGGGQGQAAVREDMAQRVLAELGLEGGEENLQLARAILGQRLPLSRELFEELRTAIGKMGSGDFGEAASLAAALKAAGLPVSAGSLQLAGRRMEGLGEALVGMAALLRDAAQAADLPEGLRAALRQGLQLLDDAVVNWGQHPEQMAARLKTAVDLLGRSLEHILREQAAKPAGEQAVWPERSLMQLARLQEQLSQAGRPELAESLGKLIEEARFNQLMSARPNDSGGWVQVGFAVRSPEGGADGQAPTLPARLRVTRRQSQGGGASAESTGLQVQVELEGGEVVEVDLRLAAHVARATVRVPDDTLLRRANEELPGLEEGLAQLGYLLKEGEVRVGKQAEDSPLPAGAAPGGPGGLFSVDLEV